MKYRTKAVVIEAMQITGNNDAEIILWAHEGLPPEMNSIITKTIGGLEIKALEDYMGANYGDWIIKGLKGEFYSCKPDIFEATYEKVQSEKK